MYFFKDLFGVGVGKQDTSTNPHSFRIPSRFRNHGIFMRPDDLGREGTTSWPPTKPILVKMTGGSGGFWSRTVDG